MSHYVYKMNKLLYFIIYLHLLFLNYKELTKYFQLNCINIYVHIHTYFILTLYRNIAFLTVNILKIISMHLKIYIWIIIIIC